MIERIARGLAIADNRGDDWQQYTDKAVGVLRLMREPTDKMLWEGNQEGGWDCYYHEDNTADIWRAMIDAALASEQPQTRGVACTE